jgi:sugar lactone lactonase YvrE
VTRRLVFFGSFLFLAALGVAVTLPGCNSSAIPAGTTATAVPFTAGTVYVADSSKSQILLFPPSPGPGTQPANPIVGSATGLSGPEYMSFDGTHQLYVANSVSSSIVVLPVGAQNNIAPVATITSPQMGQLYGVAVDSNLNIYATTVQAGTSQLLIFPAHSSGSVTNETIVTGASLSSPRGLTFDGKGNLWVANAGNGSVVMYTPAQLTSGSAPIGGSISPAASAVVTTAGMVAPSDVIFDGNGDMYVSDSVANTVFVFPPNPSGATTPLGTVGGSNTNLNAPSGIALGVDGTLYVANFGNKNLLLFAPRIFTTPGNTPNANTAPEATISNGLSSVSDVELTF